MYAIKNAAVSQVAFLFVPSLQGRVDFVGRAHIRDSDVVRHLQGEKSSNGYLYLGVKLLDPVDWQGASIFF